MFPAQQRLCNNAHTERGNNVENRSAAFAKCIARNQKEINDPTKITRIFKSTCEDEVKSSNSLQKILDNVNKEHVSDVQDYSSGHLNESKLYRPSLLDDTCNSKWATSCPLPHVPAFSVPPRRETLKESAMKTSLRYFSVDLPNVQPTIDKGSLSRKKKFSRVSDASTCSSKSRWIDDRVLVEELQPKTPVIHFKDLDHDDVDHQRQVMLESCMPIHLNGITKKDQLNKLKRYERNVLKKQEAEEQHVLTGLKAVEDLEVELQLALEMLQQKGYGPNFHRLQVYSNIFQKLVDRSPTFGYILHKIKTKYDDYVASLLDTPMVQHQVLADQMEDITANINCNMTQLQQEMKNLSVLEEEAISVLQENDRLRQLYKMKDELQSSSGQQTVTLVFKDTVTSVEISSEKTTPVSDKVVQEDLADKVEHLHRAIWQRLTAISDLRRNLTVNFVPISVCAQLQQCVKDTEMELQKLNGQKDYIEKNSKALKEQLIQDIEDADTTEKDARQIWKKINAEAEDDESYDDEQKWSWYIS